MAQQDLHETDVNTLFQELGREAVTKRMRCEAVAEMARLPCAVEGPASRLAGKRSDAFAVGEKPLAAAMDFPDLTQHGQGRLAQRQGTLFIAFADDPQEHPLGVDGGDGQCNRFADPQTAGVDQGETAAVDGLVERGDQAAAVGITADVGQAFAVGLADFFFVNSGHS